MELITSTDVVRNLCKKMAPPLVTLLSAEPEIQYVALRNINLIVQKRPTILAHEIKVNFFDLLFMSCVHHVARCVFVIQLYVWL
jgi:vesicle coat complex subunit